jgi:hypothetical protein
MSYPPPAGVNFQRLRPFLQDALRQQKDKRTALAIAQRLDRDEWRAIAQFNVVGDDLDRSSSSTARACRSWSTRRAPGG